jgi:diguanylate cyclase (GGDEF)-like protein
MEIRSLLYQLARKWWLIVPIFVIGLGSTLVFTFAQRPTYEAESTLLVTPSTAFADDLSAFATLSRQPEIAETYAQIASSRAIRQQAVSTAEMSFQEQSATRLSTTLVPGTNVLRLTVTAPTSELAERYNAAIHTALLDYTADLGSAFELRTLDEPNADTTPVSPNVPTNVVLGTVASLVLAIGAGIAALLLAPGPRSRTNLQMLDRDGIAYSEPFFVLRMRQEMSRATRSKSKLVVALVNMDHGGVLQGLAPRARSDALRRLAGLLDSHLRVEDVGARIGPYLFALLLPDTSEEEAVVMVEAVRRRISVPTVVDGGGEQIRVQPAAGLVEFSGQAISSTQLLEQARSALRDAETLPVGRTQAFSALRPA